MYLLNFLFCFFFFPNNSSWLEFGLLLPSTSFSFLVVYFFFLVTFLVVYFGQALFFLFWARLTLLWFGVVGWSSRLAMAVAMFVKGDQLSQ